MKRVWGHVLAGLSLLGAGGIVFAACVHNDSSIFVQDVLSTQEVTNNTPCVFTNETTQTILSSGVLDVDFKLSYDAWFLLGNQLVAEANSSQLMTETSDVTIQGAVVEITDASGKLLNTYTRLAAATIYPSNGSTPGYAPIGPVTIVDSNTIASDEEIQSLVVNAPVRAASVRLITRSRFFGKTTGGKDVESDEFEFPVDVCKGCLITFSPADVNGGFTSPNCYGPCGNSTPSTAPIPCVPGQDLPIDCAQCKGTVGDCNPPAAALPDGGCPMP